MHHQQQHHQQQQQQQPAGLLQRGIQILTQATSLDAQQRYHEAVEAYHSGIATLYLAYAGIQPTLSLGGGGHPTFKQRQRRLL